MKTENWFQLRIVGVTAIREPGFGRASSIAIGAAQSWGLDSCNRASGKPETVPSLN